MSKTPLWPAPPVAVRGTLVPTVKDLAVRLGNERTNQPRPYDLTVRELGYHAYVDGPAGFGKTTTLLELVAGLIESPAAAQFECPVVFVNMKPDPEVTHALEAMASAGGRKFYRVTNEAGGYDPFAGKSWSEIASQVMEAEANSQDGGFSEPHYRRAAERFLRFSARALVELAVRDPKKYQRDYLSLARLLDVDAMTAAAPRLSGDLANEWAKYSQELARNKHLIEAVDGLRQRVAGAAEGGARNVLRAAPDSLRLEEAIEEGSLILFDLDAAADATTARLIGNLALQDVAASMARLARRQWHYAMQGGQLIRDGRGDPIQVRHMQLIVDEFGALGGTILAGVFQRLRSQGGGVLLSGQEKASLDSASDTFAETVLTNANVLMLHHQGPNASYFAEQIGTKDEVIETQQIFEEGSVLATHVYASGQGNLRHGKGFRVHPDELRALTPGQVVVRVNSRVSAEDDSAHLARVQVRRLAQQRHRETGSETEGTAVEPETGPTPSKKLRRHVRPVAAAGGPVPGTGTEPAVVTAPAPVRKPLPAPAVSAPSPKPRVVPVQGISARTMRPLPVPQGVLEGPEVEEETTRVVPTPEQTDDQAIPWDDYDE